MTLVKFNQRPVRKNLNSVFDEFLNDFPSFWGRDWNYASPAVPPVNIVETNDAYHLELKAPGLNKEDFKVDVKDNVLTIGYERNEEKNADEYNVVRKEFSQQSFTRSFNLDEKVNAENIQAKYENGLLKLLLPKKAELKEAPKTIEIK